MKKELRIIVGGLLLMLVIASAVFFGLYRFLDVRTEKDVREIARVFLGEIAGQESSRYEAIKAIRYTQIDSMHNELETSGAGNDPAKVKSVLGHSAAFQNLANCTLISASGHMQTCYGDPIARLGDESFLMERLASGQKQIVTGGWTEKEQMIIFAAPFAAPMENGETSVGLLWCKPISLFAQVMNLNNPDSMVYFFIIRRDTSYVIHTEETVEENYDELVRKHVIPEGVTPEECIELLHNAIATDSVFTMHTHFVDDSQNLNVRRSVHGMPLKDSNWYLLSIIPYGALDETIAEMGHSRSLSMLVAVFVLFAALLAVFGVYIRIVRRQMTQLEKARSVAESASQEAHQAQEAAEAARAEAEAANRAKGEFLSNMSHDIRTPMNAIVGMTAIAEDHIGDQERVRDCLKKISLSGKQLLGLVNDILDMSKIESGKMTLNPEPLSLRQTMETICDIVRPQIKANGQLFDIFIRNILAEEVYCDGLRLNQVLLNFLSNAMKFTPEGGRIDLTLWQEPSPKGESFVRTHFSVRDTGMGMSEEFRSKLFTAFEREDNLRVHKTQGTGLGLAIVKYIVDAMGGTIEVASQVGEGTDFHVTVDLEKVPADPQEMVLPDWKILVVDDSPDLCETASLSLRELGTRPETCLSGEEALEKVLEADRKGEGYFALLIDYRLGGMSGIETARRIREQLGDRVPIRLISAYEWADIAEEAAAAGITGFIPKPLFKSTLYRELKKLSGEAEARAADSPERTENIAGLRILLAEDNDINAEIASMILEESGCAVERAEDGKTALDMFAASPQGYFDAILMDLRMPHMNGIEATENIRKLHRADAARVPIIAMTADAFEEDARKCLAAGMNAHLAKPIDIELLKKTLAKLVPRARRKTF